MQCVPGAARTPARAMKQTHVPREPPPPLSGRRVFVPKLRRTHDIAAPVRFMYSLLLLLLLQLTVVLSAGACSA